MKVKLLINPGRLYSMAYDKDEVVEIEDALAKVMIEDGHATADIEDKVETEETQPNITGDNQVEPPAVEGKKANSKKATKA